MGISKQQFFRFTPRKITGRNEAEFRRMMLIRCPHVNKIFCSIAIIFLFINSIPAKLYLDLGPGVNYCPDYDGSKNYSFGFVPLIELNYEEKWYELYLGTLNGAGGSLMHEPTGLYLSGDINFGDSREEADDIPALKNSGQINNPIQYEIEAGCDFDYLTVLASTHYYPAEVKYRKSIGSDFTCNAVLVSPEIESGLPLVKDKMFLLGNLTLNLMNSDYAKAYYSAHYETAERKKFTAKQGIKSVEFELEYVWLGILPNVWLYSSQTCELLLGDAAKSPYSKSDLLSTTLVGVMYRFK